ncbi:MAG: RNA-protein complex protein Nop10 [Methanoregulaceae archaeon]|nr:RNA-protein complex protein Nop10 [Methanoregulaceae archaeon]
MTGRIRRCPADMGYTLKDTCPACGTATVTPHPAHFSPEDRYGKYRRIGREWTR